MMGLFSAFKLLETVSSTQFEGADNNGFVKINYEPVESGDQMNQE